ncbi:hypothetical protein ACTXT7_009279 [Hymenolepis weldensis]
MSSMTEVLLLSIDPNIAFWTHSAREKNIVYALSIISSDGFFYFALYLLSHHRYPLFLRYESPGFSRITSPPLHPPLNFVAVLGVTLKLLFSLFYRNVKRTANAKVRFIRKSLFIFSGIIGDSIRWDNSRESPLQN